MPKRCSLCTYKHSKNVKKVVEILENRSKVISFENSLSKFGFYKLITTNLESTRLLDPRRINFFLGFCIRYFQSRKTTCVIFTTGVPCPKCVLALWYTCFGARCQVFALETLSFCTASLKDFPTVYKVNIQTVHFILFLLIRHRQTR